MQSGPSVCVFNFCIISALFIHFPRLQGELHLFKLNHMTSLSQWKVRRLSICQFKANIFKEFACFFQLSCPFPGSQNGTLGGMLLLWMKFWAEKTRGAQPQSSSPLTENMSKISCCKPRTAFSQQNNWAKMEEYDNTYQKVGYKRKTKQNKTLKYLQLTSWPGGECWGNSRIWKITIRDL